MENPNSPAPRVMVTRQGYIKLPRELLAAPIAKRPQRLALFVHLLLMANREAKDWHGIRIERGQVITSLRLLSKSCGLTVSGVRTALQGLCREGIAQVSARVGARPQRGGPAQVAAQGYTLIEICDFDSYEGPAVEARTGSRALEGAAPARSGVHKSAPTKEDKNMKFLSIVENDDPRFLEPVRIWLEYKKEKREALTEIGFSTLWKRIKRESGGDPSRAMEAVEYSMEVPYKRLYFPDRSKPCAKHPETRGRTEIPDYDPNNFKSTLL